MPLKLRSLVGLSPLLAMETFPTKLAEEFLDTHMRWFAANRPYIQRLVARWQDTRKVGELKEIVLLAMVRGSDLGSVLTYMLDPQEF
jgi:hypothetical protein